MTVSILYPIFNRKAFVQKTWALLIQNTNWEMVDHVTVTDDGSADGAREWVEAQLADCPVPAELVYLGGRSPVAAMRHHAEHTDTKWMAKIDSDIAVPPGWLDAMLAVAADNHDLQAIGMEAGRCGVPYRDGWKWDGIYRAEPCSHIGGVGLIQNRTVREAGMVPDGFYGWTEAQTSRNIPRAWISPDLAVPQLDRVPLEPWVSLTEFYVGQEWSRAWPAYSERWMDWYWEWML